MKFMVGLLFLAVGATGCGPDPSEQAVALIREACAQGVAGPDAAAEIPELTSALAEERLGHYEDGGRLVSRAATLDPQWTEMQRSYSALIDAWGYIASMPNPAQPGRAALDRLASIIPDATAAESLIRAECRKTEGRS